MESSDFYKSSQHMQIDRAAEILRAGGIVAFPTETVYGLGADATNSTAIDKIFAAKDRPITNPLIVHVADVATAKRYARVWPNQADQLAKRFWPGPLTLVLPKADSIVAQVTSGRDTVGLRVPNHPMALDLLRAFAGPIAAPSANRANRVSPTSADDVRAELGHAADMILDGGPCSVGIESTVIDLSDETPRILRPGGITRAQIEAVIGPVESFHGSTDTSQPAASPGQHPRHYSPVTPAFRFERAQRDELLQKARGGEPIVVMIVGRDKAQTTTPGVIEMPDDPADYARELYRILRAQDAHRPPAIFIELPPDEPAWSAVRDRITRAAKA